MNIDLSAPIWAIEHVAEAFHLSVDTAREHTYHHDFPAAKVGFAPGQGWTHGSGFVPAPADNFRSR